jgi:hypothetical protein
MDQVSKAVPGGLEMIEDAKAKAARAPARQKLPEGFQAEKTLKLAVPVEFDGVLYDTVFIRRLKGKDFLAMQSSDVPVLSLVTGLPAEVIAELDGEDFENIAEGASDFLPPRLRAALGMISAAGQGSPQ